MVAHPAQLLERPLHGRLRVITELARELVLLRIERIACVADEGPRTVQPLEEAARQHGLALRYFPAEDEAEAWLREDDAAA